MHVKKLSTSLFPWEKKVFLHDSFSIKVEISIGTNSWDFDKDFLKSDQNSDQNSNEIRLKYVQNLTKSWTKRFDQNTDRNLNHFGDFHQLFAIHSSIFCGHLFYPFLPSSLEVLPDDTLHAFPQFGERKAKKIASTEQYGKEAAFLVPKYSVALSLGTNATFFHRSFLSQSSKEQDYDRICRICRK